MKTKYRLFPSRNLLGSLLAATVAVGIFAGSSALAADGAAVYGKKCKSCHGADGKGDTKMGKKLKCRDLSSASVQAKLTDAAIVKSIKEGVEEGGKMRMKPVKGLSDADIQAVVKYVRTLKK